MPENLAELKTKSKIALDAMEEHAKRIGTSGVAVFLYSDQNEPEDICSFMRIVGAMNTIAEDRSGYNCMALAYSKIAESLETGKDSGNLARPMIVGEFGYLGSTISKSGNGVIITSFSGSTGDIDLKIAQSGMKSIL